VGDTLRFAAVLVLVVLCLVQASVPVRADNPNDLKSLMVYGRDWIFAVREPDGWLGDTGSCAADEGVNILFLPAGKTMGTSDVNVSIVVWQKTDDDLGQDLAIDMQRYKKQYPKIRFSDFSAHDDCCTTWSKVYYYAGRQDWTVYVNPGRGYKWYAVISLETQTGTPSTAELAALREIVATFKPLNFKIRAPSN